MYKRNPAYKLRNLARDTIIFGIILGTGIYSPAAVTGEARSDVAVFQARMSASQATFDQQMSAVQDGILREQVYQAEKMLEKRAESGFQEIELAVEKSRFQLDLFESEINIALPPVEVNNIPGPAFARVLEISNSWH